MRRLVISLGCSAVLFGCASSVPKAVPYVAAASATPHALLSDKLPTVMSRQDSTTVSVVDDSTCSAGKATKQLLFRATFFNRSRDPKPVPIAAGVPVTFHYASELLGNRSCSLYAQAQFESGKSYSLFSTNKFHGPFSLKANTCSFIIMDDTTKAYLPLLPSDGACRR